MNFTVELLDRQVAFLLDQPDDAAFLIQIEPFLRALRADDLLASYLEDLHSEVATVVQLLETVDGELVPELNVLRTELVALRPEADDSDEQAPAVQGPAPDFVAVYSFRGTLAYFDQVAASSPKPFNHEAEGGRARDMLGVLQAKDRHYLERLDIQAPREAASEPAVDSEALDRWRGKVGNVDRRLNHARRWYRLRLRTSAGIGIINLDLARDAMQPPLRLIDLDEGVHSLLTDTLKLLASSDYSLLKLADDDALSRADIEAIAERVADLRTSVRRVHEELRRRIGAARSRRALIDRFKQRCEWHDRDRLIAVAEDTRLGGGPEDRLTAELARYLFDQGLSPISKPMTGGLQPDLLDPRAGFYVEAKQYSSSARGDVVAAVAQVMDTVGRLRGGPYEVEEAFCVVFRRSGPYYDMPATLRTPSLQLHLVLIDLASASASGRRQKEKPSVIDPAEFFAAESELTKPTV